MIKQFNIRLLLAFIISFSTNAQDYKRYHELINTAEEKFVTLEDSSCFELYDQAFKSYEPFLKDPYIAAQIALFLKDTTRFYHYLKICFKNGMPISSLNASSIIKDVNKGTMAQTTNKIFAEFFQSKKVDSEINDIFCLKCYQSDSLKMSMGRDEYKIAIFNENENQTRRYIRDSFLINGIFPNERLIGISTTKLSLDFYNKYNRPDLYSGMNDAEEYELRRKCPYNIILHSHCFFQENKLLFWQAVMKGYLHPKEYGILEETSIIWYKPDANSGETCSKPQAKICYNILKNGPQSPQIHTTSEEGKLEVEANRNEIYMQKYSIDILKKDLEKTFGFKFFFDFIDR